MALANKFIRSFYGLLILFSLIVVGIWSLTLWAYDAMVVSGNVKQVQELSRQSIRRAELVIDSTVLALSELVARRLEDCSMGSVIEIRRASFQTGFIKDVQVLNADNQLICAGNFLSREIGAANFGSDGQFLSSNPDISFYTIGERNSGLIGVGRKLANGLTFLAVLNLDSLMLDVFPAALSDHARADLLLGGSWEIASQVPGTAPSGDHVQLAGNAVEPPASKPGEMTGEPDEIMEILSESTRYPLVVKFNVHMSLLHVWNRDARGYVAVGGVLLGVILGMFSVSIVGRPQGPDEELRCALANGEFVPYMQPIFSIGSLRIVGCEVLTRWIKPDGTIVQPYRFIQLAEDNGLIVPMTWAIMKSALTSLKPLMQSDKSFKVAFNIAPFDLVSPEFSKELCAIIKQAGVARRQIVLELTERQDFSDLKAGIAAIRALRELGFVVSLDDTGTGHNGLSHVQQLEADIIKIDKHFIDRIGVDLAATTIVKMLVGLAGELGMRTVAEGIESETQLLALRECGVDEGQGYLISPPVPPQEFLEFVSLPTGMVRIGKAA